MYKSTINYTMAYHVGTRTLECDHKHRSVRTAILCAKRRGGEARVARADGKPMTSEEKDEMVRELNPAHVLRR
jgi:hypothetical protein